MKKEDELSSEERKEVKKEIRKMAQERAIKNASALKNEYKNQVSIAIITAFGLVIALVWKDVITALMPSITTPGFLAEFPLLSALYAAFVVTALAVIGILLISNWAKSEEKNNP
jgi:hypothetical protein